MSTRMHVCLMAAYSLLAIACLGYAYLFEHVLQPSLPIIPIGMALLALGCAGAVGNHFAQLTDDE